MLLSLFLLASTAFGAGDLDRARTLVESGQYDAARALLEKTVTAPALKSESLVLLTRTCTRSGDWKKGLTWGKQAVAAAPHSSRAHYEYAVALREQLSAASWYKQVFLVGGYRDELAKAVQLDEKNLEAREEEIGFLMSAPSVAGGDADKAKRRAEELAVLDPARGTRMLAAAKRRAGDLDGAVTTLRLWLTKNPDDADARLALGTTLQQAKRYSEADPEFERLIRQGQIRHSLFASYQMARSRILGQYETSKAVDLLVDYIQRVPEPSGDLPDKSNAYRRLGNAYQALQQMDKARQAYQTAIDLDVHNDEARKELAALPRR